MIRAEFPENPRVPTNPFSGEGRRTVIAKKESVMSRPGYVTIPYLDGDVDILTLSYVISVSYSQEENTFTVMLVGDVEVKLNGDRVALRNMIAILKKLNVDSRMINLFLLRHKDRNPDAIVPPTWHLIHDDPTKEWNV